MSMRSTLQAVRQKWKNELAPAPRTGAEKLALGLGLFGGALGLAELLAPERMARLVGLANSPQNLALLRAAGLRELSSSLPILMHERPTRWLWSRLAGDALDLTVLAGAMVSPEARRDRATLAALAVLGVGVLDLLCAEALATAAAPNAGAGPVAAGALSASTSAADYSPKALPVCS